MQLVAYGAQDIYLTGNPQITFFKVVYRRHTNFSMESIKQSFSGDTNAHQSPVCTISRNGDLVYKMYLVQTKLHDAEADTNDNVIKTVELEIGGQRIDIQSIKWMNTWNELSTPVSKSLVLKSMQGLFGSGPKGVNYFHIPIQFWFCRNAGLALPLIALQYHEVKVKFVLGAGASVNQGLSLYCDYIYLDTDERRRFAQGAHEYLIEQVQEQTIHKSGAQKLGFNHPVKELIWRTNYRTGAQLKLNGHDRFSKRPAEYFELQQPYDYHTHCPRQNLPEAALIHEGAFSGEGEGVPVLSNERHARTSNATSRIGVYSFALKPEEHQPSGTCNFSRIDSAELTLALSGPVSDSTIYAVNYNVLRIMSGMGGLAYSN
jgi:hypothetical protein